MIAAWLLFGVVALAPLPFGSFELTAVAFWCIALGVCLIFAPVRALQGGQLALVGLAGLVVLAYGFVLHEQLADRPWVASYHPIWRQAAAALGVPIKPSVSIARNQPWFDLGRPLVCMLAIACGFLVGGDRYRARQLLKVIAWSGVAYAAYGILAHLFDPTHLLWRDKDAYLASVTGTFINRNTAGAYFGSCAVCWSLLLWERVRLETPPGLIDWRKLATRLLNSPPRKVVVYFVMLFITLAAMFMTGSRGAVVISLFALVLAFAVFFRRDLPPRSGFAVALAGGGAAAIILFQLMGAGVEARFNINGIGDEGRLETYKSTLRMIADHPWFGTGLISRVRDLAASDPATLNPIVGLLANANSEQSVAIGTGLGQVALMAVKTDQAYANQIQESVATAVQKGKTPTSAAAVPPGGGSNEPKIGAAVKTVDQVQGTTERACSRSIKAVKFT
ncbi:MAG TPA: O-antigen ligase family protein [Xanthobacteraceae bacterium]|nr:O-antigen ligase family protein [Xanthobacteraceae bacterium]